MQNALKISPFGVAMVLALLGIPFLGCILTIVYHNAWWLVLLVPLIVFMEGGIFMIVAALIVVSLFVSIF